jgi:hypothetical protein
MEPVFGKAVDEFYKKLFMMTDSLVVVCNEPSPALFAVAANMMCQAAEEAIRKFSVDPTARNVGHSQ